MKPIYCNSLSSREIFEPRLVTLLDRPVRQQTHNTLQNGNNEPFCSRSLSIFDIVVFLPKSVQAGMRILKRHRLPTATAFRFVDQTFITRECHVLHRVVRRHSKTPVAQYGQFVQIPGLHVDYALFPLSYSKRRVFCVVAFCFSFFLSYLLVTCAAKTVSVYCSLCNLRSPQKSA